MEIPKTDSWSWEKSASGGTHITFFKSAFFPYFAFFSLVWPNMEILTTDSWSWENSASGGTLFYFRNLPENFHFWLISLLWYCSTIFWIFWIFLNFPSPIMLIGQIWKFWLQILHPGKILHLVVPFSIFGICLKFSILGHFPFIVSLRNFRNFFKFFPAPIFKELIVILPALTISFTIDVFKDLFG